MKKLFLLIAALCLMASSAIAQTQLTKGNILLGVTTAMSMDDDFWGSEFMGFGFSTSKIKYGSDPAVDDHKTSTFNLQPKAGFFLMDNLVAGLEVMISSYMSKDTDDGDKYGEMVFGVGPFVRYYYPMEKFYPFAELETMFGSYREDWQGDIYKEGLMMVGVNIGAALPLGEKVTFDAMAGYSSITWTSKDEEDGETHKYMTGGFGLKMGFSVYL